MTRVQTGTKERAGPVPFFLSRSARKFVDYGIGASARPVRSSAKPSGSQQDFPVVTDGSVVGILRRNDLVRALAHGRREARVSEAMCRECQTIAASAPLDKTLERMRGEGCAALAVMDENKLVGLLTLENIGELVMVKSASRRARRPRLNTTYNRRNSEHRSDPAIWHRK